MIQQTVARLRPLAAPRHFWIITNQDLYREINRQLPGIDRKQTVPEPVGRNTAPAIGLAAFILLRRDPQGVIGMFPSDHVVADEKRFRAVLATGIELAAAGDNIVVMGIKRTRPETGYGYIVPGKPLGSARKAAFLGHGEEYRQFPEIHASSFSWEFGALAVCQAHLTV